MEKSPNNRNDNQFQQAFIQDIDNRQTLVAKELLVIESEEVLLKHRIHVLNDFLLTLATDDPQYGMIRAAQEMDRIELTDLSVRKEFLLQKKID